MLGPDDLGDLVAKPLRERRRRAAGRDRDGDRILAVQRGQDEGAELGDVDDVAEERAGLGVGEDAPVDGRVGRGGDDEVAAVEVGAAGTGGCSSSTGSAATSGATSGATTVTTAPQSSRPLTFSCATRPAPTTSTLRPSRSTHAT